MGYLVQGAEDGTTVAHKCSTNNIQYEISGTMGGATVTVEYQLPGGTFTVLDGISHTVVDVNQLDVVPNAKVRFVIAGGTGESIDILVVDVYKSSY